MTDQIFYLKDADGNFVPYKLVPVEDDVDKTPDNTLPEVSGVKVAFVVGHYSLDGGAYSDHLQSNEYNLWNAFCDSHLSGMGDKFLHSTNSSYTTRQTETAEKTKDYDLVFELHFNAFNESAEGVEALTYKGNADMETVGQYFCDTMAADMGFANRDVDPIDSGNGFTFLQKTHGDAILLEPFFGDNKSDCDKYDPDKYAEVIRKTIEKYKSVKGL